MTGLSKTHEESVCCYIYDFKSFIQKIFWLSFNIVDIFGDYPVSCVILQGSKTDSTNNHTRYRYFTQLSPQGSQIKLTLNLTELSRTLWWSDGPHTTLQPVFDADSSYQNINNFPNVSLLTTPTLPQHLASARYIELRMTPSRIKKVVTLPVVSWCLGISTVEQTNQSWAPAVKLSCDWSVIQS